MNPVLIARRIWRRLISMRTALVLLFLLAIASVPGSLLPQRPLNPTKVDNYLATHGGWGRFLNSLGMFDVFGTPWFAAIYLLLFVSLVGCLVPRIRVHYKAMRAKPLPAPRHLRRLPENGEFQTSATPEVYADAARSVLGRRWRVARRGEPSGAITLSAEKGYSRETANLLFHIGLLTALILIAIGRLYNYSGTVIIQEGKGFCNTVLSYDSWRPGRFAQEGKVSPAPFCIDRLNKFTASYTASGEATKFRADVTYSKGTDGKPEQRTISVNHPLRLEGDRVYLIGHGYAPKITVRMPDGTTRTDAEAFLPRDATTLLSEGAFKLQGPTNSDGANTKDIGIEGLFAPTAADSFGGPITANSIITSTSPQVTNPMLSIFAYQGDLGLGKGVPQSVYSLDKTDMKKIGAANLREGQTVRLPGGVQVTFDGWVNWASIQVSHDPTQGYLLFVAIVMIAGLIGSLSIRRRRLWVRISDQAGATVVAVGGLARTDSGNFSTEFADLFERLESAAPASVEPRVTLSAGSAGGTGSSSSAGSSRTAGSSRSSGRD